MEVEGVTPSADRLCGWFPAWWLGWLPSGPVNQKVAGLVPGQGTHPGCGFSPQKGHVREATDRFFCSFSLLFLFLPLSLKSVNMSLGEDI